MHDDIRHIGMLAAAVMLIAGAWLLGSGVTGLVISQSCCAGPDCPVEYVCDYAEPALESPSPVRGWGGVGGGALVILGSFALFLLAHRRH